MEGLSKALSEALEDKISLSDQENDLCSSSLNSSKLARRSLRKRRGRKRRLDPNPIWEFSVVLSDQSDTSLDEALKDYMQNVTETAKDGHSDSTNEDHMLKKLSSLNVTSSSNLYGESDSVAESNQLPKRALRKKKSRPKRMAVDGGTQSCIGVTRSCSLPDFTPQIKRKKQRLKKSQRKNEQQNGTMEVPNYERMEARFSNDKKAPTRSKTPSKGQKLMTQQYMDVDSHSEKCRTSSPETAGAGRSKVAEESRMQSSSSDGTICRTDDRTGNAMSGNEDDDDDTSETLLGRE